MCSAFHIRAMLRCSLHTTLSFNVLSRFFLWKTRVQEETLLVNSNQRVLGNTSFTYIKHDLALLYILILQLVILLFTISYNKRVKFKWFYAWFTDYLYFKSQMCSKLRICNVLQCIVLVVMYRYAKNVNLIFNHFSRLLWKLISQHFLNLNCSLAINTG